MIKAEGVVVQLGQTRPLDESLTQVCIVHMHETGSTVGGLILLD